MAAARSLTREEQGILDSALLKSIKLIGETTQNITTSEATKVGLQDGMLAHYLGQASAADANVEARIEREPFDCFAGPSTLSHVTVLPVCKLGNL